MQLPRGEGEMDGVHLVEQLKLGRTSTEGTSKHRAAKDGRKSCSCSVTCRLRCLHLSVSLSKVWWIPSESRRPCAPRVTWKLPGTSRVTCRLGVTGGDENKAIKLLWHCLTCERAHAPALLDNVALSLYN